jgi:murein peptide amidase A
MPDPIPALRPRHWLPCLLMIVLLIAACARQPAIIPPPPASHPADAVFPPEVTAPKTLTRELVIGESVENRPLTLIEMGDGDDVVLIIATIHGDEAAGTRLAQLLVAYLNRYPDLLDGRRVVILPEINPDGRRRQSRYNARSVDLNRNFSAENRVDSETNGWFPLSEPESRTIAAVIEAYRPNRVITIHQPLACIDYDGPAVELARQMARYCHLPVRKLGARPGSLGSFVGLTLGIPIITFEMPASADDLPPNAFWRRYGPAILAGIRYAEDREVVWTFSEPHPIP